MKRVNFNNKYLNRGYMKLKMRLMIYVGLGGVCSRRKRQINKYSTLGRDNKKEMKFNSSLFSKS